MGMQYACGHKSEWGTEGYVSKRPCYSCRAAKIGQRIKIVRFGTPVAQSRNWAENRLEKGMSCYEIGVDVIRSEFAERADVYIGTGVLVGFGSDDEPLVAEAKVRRASAKQKTALGL